MGPGIGSAHTSGSLISVIDLSSPTVIVSLSSSAMTSGCSSINCNNLGLGDTRAHASGLASFLMMSLQYVCRPALMARNTEVGCTVKMPSPRSNCASCWVHCLRYSLIFALMGFDLGSFILKACVLEWKFVCSSVRSILFVVSRLTSVYLSKEQSSLHAFDAARHSSSLLNGGIS